MEQRLALATPQDTVRGIFFISMLGVVRALDDDAAVERCLEACGERNFLEFFNYPVSIFIRLTYTAGQVLSTRYGSFDEALRQLGRRAMEDFLESAMGKTLKHLAGQDIRSLVSSIQGIYRMTMSYGERLVVWEGPTRGRLILKRNFIPRAYHEGGLRTTLDRMGAQNVKVAGRQTGPLDSEYEFSWD
ncbi:DUF2378 family protein [Vitiosangium sp. GDMCC 1.1324]|uniref:DUF2378 family protein n=1 Tax=Vitiosangium sp. (strain GDMCC 1.1324) TaxID=2138576 RepID=UPI001E3E35A5|nr:DUF2378 family protein [Vitiosangium sp. GDMCC 1.1324]